MNEIWLVVIGALAGSIIPSIVFVLNYNHKLRNRITKEFRVKIYPKDYKGIIYRNKPYELNLVINSIDNTKFDIIYYSIHYKGKKEVTYNVKDLVNTRSTNNRISGTYIENSNYVLKNIYDNQIDRIWFEVHTLRYGIVKSNKLRIKYTKQINYELPKRYKRLKRNYN